MGNQLSGTIPSSFGNLANLQSVCAGPPLRVVPAHATEKVSAFSRPGMVPRRWLVNNQLSGTIPSSFGNLINLETLCAGLPTREVPGRAQERDRLFTPPVVAIHRELAVNQLTGTIPSSCGNFASLQYLCVGLPTREVPGRALERNRLFTPGCGDTQGVG